MTMLAKALAQVRAKQQPPITFNSKPTAAPASK
jgi:hypothetical protein